MLRRRQLKPAAAVPSSAAVKERFITSFLVALWIIYIGLMFQKAPAHSHDSSQHKSSMISSSLRRFRMPSLGDNKKETTSKQQPWLKGRCEADSPRRWHYPESKLAQWTKDYLDWHYETRCQEQQNNNNNQQVSINLNTSTTKYLVIQCLNIHRCGGTADRLQPLPAYVLRATILKRIILIEWERPCRLEEFFIPPLDGIDWTVPEWLRPGIPRRKSCHYESLHRMMRRPDTNETVLTGKVQTFAHSLLTHYNREKLRFSKDNDNNPDYPIIFHDMFRAFFALSPPVERIVSRTMSQHGLEPNEFVTAHIRARYPLKSLKNAIGHEGFDKGGNFPFEENRKVKDIIVPVAENAIRCAAFILPDRPIYVASDSDQVVAYLMKDSMFAKQQQQQGQKKQQYQLTSVAHNSEPLHLDTNDNDKHSPEEFYSIFVDLWILGQARCTSYGMGGFGRFGMYMSYNATCSANHRKYTGIIQECPLILDST